MLTHLPTSKNRLPLTLLTAGVVVAGMVAFTHPTLVEQVRAQVQDFRLSTSTEMAGDATSADNITLTAIPPRLGDDGSLTIKPGEKKQITLKVRNSSTQTIRVESLVNDFVLAEDGETPMPVKDTVSNRWSLASWITISPSSQVLSPNELAVVNAVIEVPADALPGGHYAMVTHQPAANSKKEDQPSNTGVNQKVGSLLYVTVAGPINEEAFIRSLNFPQFMEFGPVPFSFVVDNASDIHIRPQITVEITNLFGARVAEMQLEPKNVFPLMSRDYSGQWERIWGIGLYNAKITMSYGASGKVSLAQTRFWLLPYKLVLAGLTILLVLIALVIVIRRHWLHRQAQTEAELEMVKEKLQKLEEQKTPKP